MDIPALISRARSGDTAVLSRLADATAMLLASQSRGDLEEPLLRRLMPHCLTPRQMDAAMIVADHLDRYAYSPSLQEIADEMGITKVVAFEHVSELVRKGVLIREKHKSRSLRFAMETL